MIIVIIIIVIFIYLYIHIFFFWGGGRAPSYQYSIVCPPKPILFIKASLSGTVDDINPALAIIRIIA